MPSTPPPSAEYFPSTPPTSSYLAFGSERGGVLSTDALRHSQLLQSRLAEVAASRGISSAEGNDTSNSLNRSSPVFVTPTSTADINSEKEKISLPGNYNTRSAKTNHSKVDNKTLDRRLKETKSDTNIDEKHSSEEYSSIKYTPETKIPEKYEKQGNNFKLSPENTEGEITKSFLGLSVVKPVEYVQKESDWSISNRVKSIFDDIKRNAISDFVKSESAKDSSKALDDKTKLAQTSGDWWSSLTDRNKLSEDLEKNSLWGYNETSHVPERNIDLSLTKSSVDINSATSRGESILEDRIAIDLEIKKLDEEVAQTMKSNTNWKENTNISSLNKNNESVGDNNARNLTKTDDHLQNGDVNCNREIIKEESTPPISEQKEVDHKNKGVTNEEAAFKRSGREVRSGSDGGGARGSWGSRGDTPPLSRESRGSLKRARRGSGEGGSPVGGGAMVEDCIIRTRVEAEKASDEEVTEVAVSTELLREGSEFSKTLKGVQTGMDSLTRLTDNVFEEGDKNDDEVNVIVNHVSIQPLNERPKVLGGENSENSENTNNQDTQKKDPAEVNLSSSENRKSWAGMESGSRDTKSDSRDSRDSDKSSMSTSSSRSDMESESTKRVRAYLESLSARIKQQIPYSSSGESHNSSSTGTSSRLVSMSSSETPPTSARLTSYSSSETPPSSACPMSLSSSETPPNSADAVAGTPGARPSLSDTPTSPAFFSSTPPFSAGFNSNNADSLSFLSNDAFGTVTPQPGILQRASSCDSINSDTSISLEELEEAVGQVTAQLSVTLIYDR